MKFFYMEFQISKIIIYQKDKNEYIVTTIGSNLKELCTLKYINQSSLTTNNLWEVFYLCGIEGARKF